MEEEKRQQEEEQRKREEEEKQRLMDEEMNRKAEEELMRKEELRLKEEEQKMAAKTENKRYKSYISSYLDHCLIINYLSPLIHYYFFFRNSLVNGACQKVIHFQ